MTSSAHNAPTPIQMSFDTNCLFRCRLRKEQCWRFLCFWNFCWLLCQSSWIFWNQEKNHFCLDPPMKLSMFSKAPFSSSFSFWKVEIVKKVVKRLTTYWWQRPRRTWGEYSESMFWILVPSILSWPKVQLPAVVVFSYTFLWLSLGKKW